MSLIFFLNIQKIEKKNILISEKYIQAGIYLTNEEKKILKLNLGKAIILSDNNFYSILSLNMILEKNLEKIMKKILKYFRIVESVKLSKEKKNLLNLKALYLIKISKNDEGKKILKELEETDSNLKNLFKEILDK